jgi:hypothetical protein
MCIVRDSVNEELPDDQKYKYINHHPDYGGDLKDPTKFPPLPPFFPLKQVLSEEEKELNERVRGEYYIQPDDFDEHHQRIPHEDDF